MGVEPSPHNPHNAGLPPALPEDDLEIHLSPEQIALVAQRDLFSQLLVKELREALKESPSSERIVHEAFEAAQSSPGPEWDRLLAAALRISLKIGLDVRIAIDGFNGLAHRDIDPLKVHHDHIILWGLFNLQIRKDLGNYAALALSSLLNESAQLIDEEVPPRLFRFYCQLARAVYRGDGGVFSANEAVAAVRNSVVLLADAPYSEDRLRRLAQFCDHELRNHRGDGISGLIAGYAAALKICGPQGTSKEGDENLRFVDETLEQLMQKGSRLETTLPGLNAVLRSSPGEISKRAALLALTLHSTATEPLNEPALVSQIFNDIASEHGLPELLLNYEAAHRAGLIRNNTDSFALLNRLAAQSLLHATMFPHPAHAGKGVIERLAGYTAAEVSTLMFSRDELREYMQEQVRFYRPLREVYDVGFLQSDERRKQDPGSFLIEPAQRGLLAWRRMVDVYTGFGALTIDARRNPLGEPALLARLGNDIGTMRHINAEDIAGFPGRGFAIGKIESARIFPSTSTRDPLEAYKRAWPAYAKALADLGGAEFIFTRGFIAISGLGRDYHLNIGGKHVPYSLVIFNSHHANPTARVACLVPSISLRELTKGALAPFNEIQGFDRERTDVNVRMKSAENLLSECKNFGPVFDVGNPRAITHGIFKGEHRRWAEYLQRFDQHSRRVQEWDRAFRSRNRAAIEEIGGYDREFKLAEDADRLEELRQELESGRQGSSDRTLWELVHRSMDLFDVFRIVHARWQRGYTLERRVPSPEDEDIEASAAQELEEDATEDQFLNRRALFLVREAYALHSQRTDPRAGKDRFPILAVTDALKYSRLPELTTYIDTYDMRVVIDGNVIELSPDELSMEDEIFLTQHFLPRAADSPGRVGGLRFIPRHYVGLS